MKKFFIEKKILVIGIYNSSFEIFILAAIKNIS